jgi:SAM-dependent methyltransferase
MMVRPAQYSHIEFPEGHVIPVHADARKLPLPSNFFDGVYSAGSIEHFGSLEAVAAAAEEMGRILKPGGVAVLSTEFRLDGPNDRRWFSNDCILFTPQLLQDYIVGPSGLELIGESNFSTSQSTFDSRVVLLDFLDKAKHVQTLSDKKNAYPNLVLFHEGFLFCSVHLAMRKPPDGASERRHVKAFESSATADATRAAAVLTAQIDEWTKNYADRGKSVPMIPIGSSAEAEIADLRSSAEAETADLRTQIQALLSSRSYRLTGPMRALTTRARSIAVTRRMGRFALRVARAVRRRIS